jgi:hypothetical protein
MCGVSATWGRLAEQAISRKYIEAGWYVVPTYAIETGGAPRLVGLLQRFVLPDLQVFRLGDAAWVEVKYKDHADIYQKRRQWQHGIDLPNWRAYLEVEDRTGIAGRLSILQFKPGKEADPRPVHLWQSFYELRKWVQVLEAPHTTFKRGAAYFPLDAFKCSPIEFEPPAGLLSVSANTNPWEQRSRAGVAERFELLLNLVAAGERDARADRGHAFPFS